jgi:hypothetical protein
LLVPVTRVGVHDNRAVDQLFGDLVAGEDDELEQLDVANGVLTDPLGQVRVRSTVSTSGSGSEPTGNGATLSRSWLDAPVA